MKNSPLIIAGVLFSFYGITPLAIAQVKNSCPPKNSALISEIKQINKLSSVEKLSDIGTHLTLLQSSELTACIKKIQQTACQPLAECQIKSEKNPPKKFSIKIYFTDNCDRFFIKPKQSDILGEGGNKRATVVLSKSGKEIVKLKSHDPWKKDKFENEKKILYAIKQAPEDDRKGLVHFYGASDKNIYLKKYSHDLFDEVESVSQCDSPCLKKRVECLKDVALGLKNLHKLGYIHSDLKLENIFLDNDGHCYLSDFDLSYDAKEKDGTQQINGTRGYMPPEIYDPIIQKDAVKRDSYSFGILALDFLMSRQGNITSDMMIDYLDLKMAMYPHRIPSSYSQWQTSVAGQVFQTWKQNASNDIPSEYFDMIEKSLSKDPQGRPTDDDWIQFFANNPYKK